MVGALHEPLGIGVHPAKLAFGYLRAARAAGACVHPASPVLWIARDGERFRVRTPGGTVTAHAIAIATGGYTSQTLHPRLRSRIMPILSNSIVTRPLTSHEMAVTGFRTRQVITDTRTLRYYYRLLPDDCLQIGTRSSITGADAANPRHLRLLVDGMNEKFPALRGIHVDYSWWGWVDVSHDMMPRIVQPDPSQRLFYALGYGGNGVSYSAQVGRRLAELVIGRPPIDLPIFQGELPGHLFAPFRRIGQRLLYRWYPPKAGTELLRPIDLRGRHLFLSGFPSLTLLDLGGAHHETQQIAHRREMNTLFVRFRSGNCLK
jgi:taurine dehydrogenase large subunit